MTFADALEEHRRTGKPMTSARLLASASLEEVDRCLATQSRVASAAAPEERAAEFARVDRLLDRRRRIVEAA
jgi:hypothetical protein